MDGAKAMLLIFANNSRVKNQWESFSNTLQKKCKEIKEEKTSLPKLKQIKATTAFKQLKSKNSLLLKKENNPSFSPYPIFRDIYQSELGQYFLEKGEDVIALNIAGHLFNYIGNWILNTVKRDYNK